MNRDPTVFRTPTQTPGDDWDFCASRKNEFVTCVLKWRFNAESKWWFCVSLSLWFLRQFLHVRNRLRPRLPSHAERRLPGPETGESPPRPRRTFENHRFWFRKETHRQVRKKQKPPEKNKIKISTQQQTLSDDVDNKHTLLLSVCLSVSVCVCVSRVEFYLIFLIFLTHNSRENVIQIRKMP